jgi:hypothetical protein
MVYALCIAPPPCDTRQGNGAGADPHGMCPSGVVDGESIVDVHGQEWALVLQLLFRLQPWLLLLRLLLERAFACLLTMSWFLLQLRLHKQNWMLLLLGLVLPKRRQTCFRMGGLGSGHGPRVGTWLRTKPKTMLGIEGDDLQSQHGGMRMQAGPQHVGGAETEPVGGSKGMQSSAPKWV